MGIGAYGACPSYLYIFRIVEIFEILAKQRVKTIDLVFQYTVELLSTATIRNAWE